MEKKLVRVPYNEKRLNFLDATMPFLVLEDESVLYNFDYIYNANVMFIRELDEFNVPKKPFKLWNFAGEDLSSYYRHIKFIEFDQAEVYKAAQEVYPEDGEEVWMEQVEQHYQTLMGMGEGICEARSDIQGTFAEQKAEQDRRQNLLQSIADRTSQDEDALPSPEVMQLRADEAQKALDEAFAPSKTSESGLIVEAPKPKIITSLTENTPTKLVL